MHALTLRQPWGFAIAHGGKRVENRSWPPPPWLTEVAIHAGARSGWDDDGEFSPLVVAAWNEYAANLPYPNVAGRLRREALHIDFSAIVAVAQVTGCHFDGQCHLHQPRYQGAGAACSPWACAGSYHWQLVNVRALATPVPCRGRQKLWTVPDEVETEIRAQIARNSRETD